MKISIKKTAIVITVIIIVAAISVPFFSQVFKEEKIVNSKPVVEIEYPADGDTVSRLVSISGISSDPNGDQTIKKVEIRFNDTWEAVEGTDSWKYTWNIFDLENGLYAIQVRAWDGAVYSDIAEITVSVLNPEIVKSDKHRWAVFIIAANFPEDNESKLGNGGLYLSEEIAEYLIENKGYPTSNIFILFDDGWIREDEGFGAPYQSLQQRFHKYDITYEGATKENVESTLKYIVGEGNKYDDSEVFIHISSHGCGDEDNFLTGGKILERSGIFLWDYKILYDKNLGDLLYDLKSKETCVIVDACYTGGFADKTIFNFPEFFLFKSGLAQNGRVIITSTSKYRVGYASTQFGPLFTRIWFEGLKTGDADGYRPGLLDMGKPSILRIFKDGKVSVEEAFYYARYMLKHDSAFKEYSKMEPQMNDRYPYKGNILSKPGLILG